MPRPRRDPDKIITPYQSRIARQQALRDAGGWIGTVELSPAAHTALRELQRGRSISETIDDALILCAARLLINGKM